MYKDVEKMYSSPKNKLIEVHTSHYPSQAFYMIDKLHKGINIFTNKNSPSISTGSITPKASNNVTTPILMVSNNTFSSDQVSYDTLSEENYSTIVDKLNRK